MRALRFLLPLALVGLCLWIVDGPDALRRLAGADPLWLLLAVLTVNAQTVLSAVRWRMTASALGLPIGTRRALREYYLAQFVNLTLPGGVAGDAARAVRSRHAAGLSRAAQAVVIERAAGQAALIFVTLASLAIVLVRPGGTGPEALPPGLPGLPMVLLVAAAVAAGVTLAVRRFRALGEWAAAAHQALLGPMLLPQAAASLVIVVLNLASFAATARATGTTLSVGAVFTLVPLILCAMILPSAIGGWGWREGAAAALFPLAGASPEAGVAASLAFGLVLLACALPGAVLMAAGPALPRPPRPAPDDIASPPARSRIRREKETLP